MLKAQNYYPSCPEGFVVSLARAGDKKAFEDLVRRRQSSIRGLMRRCCGDGTLADDLAQQIFLRVWLKIHTLKKASAFSGWLKRLAISVWLQHIRKNDALRNAGELVDIGVSGTDTAGIGMDLDLALSSLPNAVRLCVVLSYHEGMSHPEIAGLLNLPLGTVKSHINRGSQRLKELLSAYEGKSGKEHQDD